MQASAPDADPTCARKVGLHRRPAFDETYAPKIEGLFRLKCDAEIAQSVNGFRHQPFAASLVYGRPCDIRHSDVKAFLTRGNGSRKPGRSAAYNENVGFGWRRCHVTTSAVRVRNRSRVP